MRVSAGFSLVEILIVLGLTIIFVGLSATVGNQAIRNAEFDRVRELIRSELASAQTDSIGGTSDSNWGVAFFPNAITRYRGTSYAARITADDRVTTFGNAVVISGTSDVTFSRPFGLPVSPATITVSDGIHTAITTVNSAGSIDVR